MKFNLKISGNESSSSLAGALSPFHISHYWSTVEGWSAHVSSFFMDSTTVSLLASPLLVFCSSFLSLARVDKFVYTS